MWYARAPPSYRSDYSCTHIANKNVADGSEGVRWGERRREKVRVRGGRRETVRRRARTKPEQIQSNM